MVAASALTAALAVELVDELVDGTKSAALPLVQHTLTLSYAQIGLLTAVPLLAGSVLELPLGLAAGQGTRRRRAILGGGLAFIGALLGAAAARSFGGLLAACVIFFPASGAFVSLTQSALMDASPGRQAQHMARWNLAGSAGAVTGPLLLAVVLAAGGTWRTGFAVLAGCAAGAWLGSAVTRQADPPGTGHEAGDAQEPARGRRPGAVREVLRVLRRGEAMRWGLLAELANLLLDVLTGFVALYFVDVVHASPAQAAVAVAVRLGAGLAADAAVVRVLERTSALRVLRVSAIAAAAAYPAFLLVPGYGPKIVILAAVSAATAPWYPVLQSELYRSLPGRSDIAVTLSTAATLAGGLGPLAVGFAAERAGLAAALGALAVVPLVLLGGLHRPGRRR
jgi:FSR family fosmidomycin resistance protein-like MFS transporter